MRLLLASVIVVFNFAVANWALSVDMGPPAPFKLGVTVQLVTWQNDPWVQFATVSPEGRAFRAGMRSGDLIKRVSNVPIYNIEQFDHEIEQAAPTGVVLIQYRRLEGATYTDGQAEILASIPANMPAPTASTFKLGVNTEVVTLAGAPWVRFKLVSKYSRAAKAGILPGDLVLSINNQKVYSNEGYDANYAAAVASGSIRILFRRTTGKETKDYEINIPVTY